MVDGGRNSSIDRIIFMADPDGARVLRDKAAALAAGS